ncbi:MAG: hypothetical protein KH253_00210 [Bifidobacterium adolescentis]|nr:hypothetical protein [Bifidobacterium adolescentis]
MLADVPAANAIARPNGPKEKIQGPTGREYWWVLNADGVDGEEGYWTTRKAKGEYKYFCDAGWGDADNAITHLEEELAD